MKVQTTEIPGAYLIDLEPSQDDRGFFSRLFCAEEFKSNGLEGKILQINNSKSSLAKTLRGLHYQLAPFEETKLVRCIQGAIFDVVLDIRPNSSTFGKWFAEVLSAENRKMMYVPRGCAHGFMTLENDSEIIYFVSEIYSKNHERGIRFDDPSFNIEWPFKPETISERDRNHPNFLEQKCAY